MTTASSMSASSSISICPSVPAGPSAPANILTPADPSAHTGLIPSPHIGLPVVQDITKPFFIGKPITAADNITT